MGFFSRNKDTIPEQPTGPCKAGGDHKRGTTGEWLVRCVKCGKPC